MVALVSRLQEENRRIQKLQESPSHESKISDDSEEQLAKNGSAANLLNATDFQVMQRLRAQIEKQRDELKTKDQRVQDGNNEIENVSCKTYGLTCP